jgi:hypothetical protein
MSLATPAALLKAKAKVQAKLRNASSEDALPFNSLELGLFAQNCFLCVFADEKDSHRLEMLFSVAILILVYFIVI